MMDLLPVVQDGTSPWHGASYERYAEAHHLVPETVAYTRDRARETQDLRLRIRYLEFALRRCEPQTGRAWIDLQRELLAAYREYIDGCRTGAAHDPHAGVHIYDALTRVRALLAVRGVVPEIEAPGWAKWIFDLAGDSRTLAGDTGFKGRWVADYLDVMRSLPATATSQDLRENALGLLLEAARHYESSPMLHYIEQAIVQIEADLRKYWGESDTHRPMIRRQFEAVLRCARMHRNNGSNLVASEFFRQAREIAESERQYFSDAEIANLGRSMQEAIHAGTAEFTRFHIEIQIPNDLVNYIRETPELTVQAIVSEAGTAIPNRARIRKDVEEGNQVAPLQAMIGRTIVGPGKVVGQTTGPDGNVELDVDFRAVLQTQALGSGVAAAIQKAAAQIALTPEHLVVPLAPLALEEGSLELMRHGFGRLIAGDPISAVHLLVPRVEDVLRQHLTKVGFDTTKYRAQEARTDDATFGGLMHAELSDGRTVRDYLGADLWEQIDSLFARQTGPNLRNEFAHGLARPRHCTPTVAGLVILVLYQLAAVAARGWSPSPS